MENQHFTLIVSCRILSQTAASLSNLTTKVFEAESSSSIEEYFSAYIFLSYSLSFKQVHKIRGYVSTLFRVFSLFCTYTILYFFYLRKYYWKLYVKIS